MRSYEINRDISRSYEAIWGRFLEVMRVKASSYIILLCSNLSVPATPEGPGADSSSTVSPGICIVHFNLRANAILCDVLCIFTYFYAFSTFWHFFCIATRCKVQSSLKVPEPTRPPQSRQAFALCTSICAQMRYCVMFFTFFYVLTCVTFFLYCH